MARNYAFTAPDSLPPGPTAFRLINQGTVLHEVQIWKFKPGIPADSAGRMLARGSVPDDATETSGGVIVASVGDTVRQQILDDLAPGAVYALVCEFRDSTGTPKHSSLGMFKVLTVR